MISLQDREQQRRGQFRKCHKFPLRSSIKKTVGPR